MHFFRLPKQAVQVWSKFYRLMAVVLIIYIRAARRFIGPSKLAIHEVSKFYLNMGLNLRLEFILMVEVLTTLTHDSVHGGQFASRQEAARSKLMSMPYASLSVLRPGTTPLLEILSMLITVLLQF
jgi:hypothetical protein